MQNEGVGMMLLLIYLAVIVLTIAGLWGVFKKAGEPGWAAIIPLVNVIFMLKVADREMWWIILYFIPIVSLIPAFIVPIDIAKNFGKGTGFGLGLVFLPFIFYPLLAFGDAQYHGRGQLAGGGTQF